MCCRFSRKNIYSKYKTLFSSEHPATVFTVLEPPPPVGPQQQQQPAKQKLTFTSDTLFDLLLLKLEKFYQKRLKIESKGSRFELGDFVVKVRTLQLKWHPKKIPLRRLIACSFVLFSRFTQCRQNFFTTFSVRNRDSSSYGERCSGWGWVFALRWHQRLLGTHQWVCPGVHRQRSFKSKQVSNPKRHFNAPLPMTP